MGVNKVKGWSRRGKVPHAAETTSVLVELQLQQKSLNSTCSSREMSYLLSMALIRFVNGIVDSGQKGTVASSALTIAEQVGLPAWFVELRHAATHDQIPTFQLLQNAQIQALEWLHNNYWEVQAGGAKTNMEVLDALLNDYLLERVSNLNTGDGKNTKLTKVLYAIGDQLTDSNYSALLFPILLERVDDELFNNVDFPTIWDPLLSYLHKKWSFFAEDLVYEIIGALNSSLESTSGRPRDFIKSSISN